MSAHGDKPGSGKDVVVKFKTVEIEAASKTDFAEATDQAIALASRAFDDIKWFEVKRLGGRIKDGKRSEYRITFLVGSE